MSFMSSGIGSMASLAPLLQQMAQSAPQAEGGLGALGATATGGPPGNSGVMGPPAPFNSPVIDPTTPPTGPDPSQGGAFSNFFKEFGGGMMGGNRTKGDPLGIMSQLPGKGDSLGMILGKILGGTKMSFNKGGSQFGIDGGALRRRGQRNQLMSMLGNTGISGIMSPEFPIAQSNPADATTRVY